MPKVPDIKGPLERLRPLVEQATEHIINLIVIFLLQTLVVPTLLLWALYRIVRALLEPPNGRQGRP